MFHICYYSPDRPAYMILSRSWQMPLPSSHRNAIAFPDPFRLLPPDFPIPPAVCIRPLHVHTHTHSLTRSITGRSSSLVHQHYIPYTDPLWSPVFNLVPKLSGLRVLTMLCL